MILIKLKPASPCLRKYFAKIVSSDKLKEALANPEADMRDLFNDADRVWELPDFKERVRSDLFEQQHGLCAYCMSQLSLSKTVSTVKIEHYHPLSVYKDQVFNYSNYLLVCNGGKDSDDDDRKTCDSRKKDLEITIDPRKPAHISHITYQFNGIISYYDPDNPQQQQIIIEDINERLNLNGITDDNHEECLIDTATDLVRGRRKAYEIANNKIKNLKSQKKLTPQSIQKLIETVEKKHLPFAGVYIYVYTIRKNTLLHNQTNKHSLHQTTV